MSVKLFVLDIAFGSLNSGQLLELGGWNTNRRDGAQEAVDIREPFPRSWVPVI